MMGAIIFTLSAGAIAYVLVIYPVALAIAARRWPKPLQVNAAAELPPIEILIPVRNGAQWIGRKLDSLLASHYPANRLRITVLSDGSNDGTDELVANYGDNRVQVVSLPAQGKAAAVNRGLTLASSDILVLTDVRQEFDPEALRWLVIPFSDPQVGVVTGELIIRKGESAEEANTGLYWKYEKWIRGNLNALDAMLGATGAIYAIRRDLTAPLPADTLLDDVHLPFFAVFHGKRIWFERRAKAYDSPTSLQSEFRRKVRTQAGIYQVAQRFPGLLWLGNRRFIHFLSHKLGRLFLPFFFLAAAVATCFLPTPFNLLFGIPQLGFYAMAMLDPWVSENSKLKRITGVARAFLVMVAAAGFAVRIFVMPAQQLWKDTHNRAGRPATN